MQVHVFQMHNRFDCVVSSLMYLPMYAFDLGSCLFGYLR